MEGCDEICVNSNCFNDPHATACTAYTCSLTGAVDNCDVVLLLDCSDGNACTVDTCDDGNCSHTPFPPCPPVNCTTCQCNTITGNYDYTPVSCPTDPCHIGYCDNSTGFCVVLPIPTCLDVMCTERVCDTNMGQCYPFPICLPPTDASCSLLNSTDPCNMTDGRLSQKHLNRCYSGGAGQ